MMLGRRRRSQYPDPVLHLELLEYGVSPNSRQQRLPNIQSDDLDTRTNETPHYPIGHFYLLLHNSPHIALLVTSLEFG